jgi:hypothetical protein
MLHPLAPKPNIACFIMEGLIDASKQLNPSGHIAIGGIITKIALALRMSGQLRWSIPVDGPYSVTVNCMCRFLLIREDNGVLYHLTPDNKSIRLPLRTQLNPDDPTT